MRFVFGVAVSTLLLVLAFQAQAGDGKKATKAEGTHGVITNVDTAAKTFTFRTGKKKAPEAKEITVLFSETTKFIRVGVNGTSQAKAEELTGKQRVAVVYATKDGKNIASMVTLTEKKKKKQK